MSANNGKIDSKLEQLKAFLLGMWEFRSDFTSHLEYWYMDAYDQGRDFAHKLTFRYFDN